MGRCSRCGGFTTAICIDTNGHVYYQCFNNQSTLFNKDDQPLTSCDMTYDENGKFFSGHIQIKTGKDTTKVLKL